MGGRGLRLRFRTSLVVATLVVIGLMAVTPARLLVQQRQRIGDTERRLASLRADNARLEAHLQRLADPGYVETLARERLGLVRPGETAFVIVPDETPASAPKPPGRTPAPWYARAWRGVAQVVDWVAARLAR